MSAIADFTVAVLDCHACRGFFIENYVVVATHARPVACPHCGADYEPEEHWFDEPGEALCESGAQRQGRRPAGYRASFAGSRRRRLH